MTEDSSTKRMRLRYAGTCRECGASLPAKTEAIYDKATKSVRCLSHRADPGEPAVNENVAHIEPGIPGASARREFERRKAKREQQIRSRHPKLGGVILAVSKEQQSTTAWDTGALGEELLGGRLNELASENLLVLHDRRIPGTRANIDHLAVTPSGIYVIDAKKYQGRPRLRRDGGRLRLGPEHLLVGSRDCTKLVHGMLKQVDVVRGVIGFDLPVRGVLCFLGADWPLVGGTFRTRGVEVLRPRSLYRKLRATGPVPPVALATVHRALADALPPS